MDEWAEGTAGMTWLIQCEGRSLGGMLEDILGNEFDSEHGLFTGWFQLRFWKEKTESFSVSELKGKCVFDAHLVSPV